MIQLIPMSETEFAAYLEKSIIRYAEENIKAGFWQPEEAQEKSRDTQSRLLPDGLKTKGHLFFKIKETDQGTQVGTTWLFTDTGRAQPTGFIYDIFIEESWRGKGIGKQTMLALEGKAMELGLTRLALHVFANNTTARRLYEGLGYQYQSMNMAKEL